MHSKEDTPGWAVAGTPIEKYPQRWARTGALKMLVFGCYGAALWISRQTTNRFQQPVIPISRHTYTADAGETRILLIDFLLYRLGEADGVNKRSVFLRLIWGSHAATSLAACTWRRSLVFAS